MSMKGEAEEFDWGWINRRRDPTADEASCLELAPQAWKEWIEGGEAAQEKVRRRVSKLLVKSKDEQLPDPGSASATALPRRWIGTCGIRLLFDKWGRTTWQILWR